MWAPGISVMSGDRMGWSPGSNCRASLTLLLCFSVGMIDFWSMVMLLGLGYWGCSQLRPPGVAGPHAGFEVGGNVLHVASETGLEGGAEFAAPRFGIGDNDNRGARDFESYHSWNVMFRWFQLRGFGGLADFLFVLHLCLVGDVASLGGVTKEVYRGQNPDRPEKTSQIAKKDPMKLDSWRITGFQVT